MDRIAVFVDAGYLFAQGSVALTGSKVSRDRLLLNDLAIVEKLTLLAQERGEGLPLLRIYWYDGVNAYRGPGAEQMRLAKRDNIKFRFGFINNAGQQKGVDSLIVTDLIDLARNRAMSDALLLSGDEDVRIGVQVAQSFGVRVHLVGIAPSRGSQSIQLIQESDSTTEWDRAIVESFLSLVGVTEPAAPRATHVSTAGEVPATSEIGIDPLDLLRAVQSVIGELNYPSKLAAQEFMRLNRGVPPDYDRRLLRAAAGAGPRISEEDRRFLRMKFRELLGTTPTT